MALQRRFLSPNNKRRTTTTATVSAMLFITIPTLSVITTSALWIGRNPTTSSSHVMTARRTQAGSCLIPRRHSMVFGAAAKGFGETSNDEKRRQKKARSRKAKLTLETLDKTYSAQQYDRFDEEVFDDLKAMTNFFETNKSWMPLFRNLLNVPSSVSSSQEQPPAAMTHFEGDDDELAFEDDDNNNVPWKKLDAIPTGDEGSMTVLASWLDTMQKSLEDIPVVEDYKGEQEDELDMHFIMEGKRMLAISRFHVLKGRRGGGGKPPTTKTMDDRHHPDLFMTCWSELAELRRLDEPDTGSVILLPDHDDDDDDIQGDLQRFADMNLRRPLKWLGLGSDVFEVSSFHRGIPAIRILHKLSDIPTSEDLQNMKDDEDEV